ncbi:hypothetical protein ACFZAM_31965 [Streptomyces sp. NPDC008079]|uniref:hypothetical protein n=1 Tax=Streptomyces sp. NPDC008079 TaxID=3364806 RepID=UPI0036E2FDDD
MTMTEIAALAVQAPEWQDRAGRTPIPLADWGRDHWSLLAVVEDCAVNGHGRLQWERLTLSYRHWPTLYAARGHISMDGSYDAKDRFPLRLKRLRGNAREMPGHCEGDALMDLRDHRLITVTMPPVDGSGRYYLRPDGRPLDGEDDPHPGCINAFTSLELMPYARFALTRLGRHYSNALRAHKATDGATWSNFIPPAEEN